MKILSLGPATVMVFCQQGLILQKVLVSIIFVSFVLITFVINLLS